MTLEHMVCSVCAAEFDRDLFGGDPATTFACPVCGTTVLDAEPVEDVILHIHPALYRQAQAEEPRLTA
jgi:hypothetical protein